MEASAQMRELEALLTQLQLSTHENDKVDLYLEFWWFFSKKAYLQIIGICDASPIFWVDVKILCHGQAQILLLVAAKGSIQHQGLA
jgi:hypothetical protein